VICGTASFYACKSADFPGIKGKESCKKWQRSFFYVKNLKEGEDHINLPPFEAGGPEQDNWSAAPPRPSPDMEKILLRITTLQTEGGLEPTDLLLAFLVARVSLLQRCSHKMCFLGPPGILLVIPPNHCQRWRWLRRQTASPMSSSKPRGRGDWSLTTGITQSLR
jgi:hypothetical protein